MLRYAALKVADSQAAEDITANTFLRLWERIRAGEKIENPRALLYVIAHGLVVDHYRKAGRQKSVSLDLFDDVFEGETEGDITSAINDRLNYAAVLSATQKLKDEYQEVLVLHYVQDISISEIAEILGEKENNVRVRLHRALAKLRDVLAPIHIS